MSTSVIYADQVILGSMVMNYVILLAVSKIGGVETGKLRLAGAAVLGGFYSILVFIPVYPPLLTFWGKLLVSLAMLFIAFFPQSSSKMLTCFIFFYLASFALGGTVMGIMYLIKSGGGVNSLPGGFPRVVDEYFWYAVIAAVAVYWGSSRLAKEVYGRRRYLGVYYVKLGITLQENEVQLDGLVDSGNQLRDPLTGNSVIVVQCSAVNELLPGDLAAYLEAGDDYDPVQAMEIIKNSVLGSRFGLVPFRSLGADYGMLLGFRPDEVKLQHGDREIRVNSITVAVHHGQLSPDSNYQALVHPELIDY